VEGVEATSHIATAATRQLLEKEPIDDKGPRVLDSAQEHGTPVVLYVRSSVHEISSDYCRKMKFFCI
jgi:hypothetical protein